MKLWSSTVGLHPEEWDGNGMRESWRLKRYREAEEIIRKGKGNWERDIVGRGESRREAETAAAKRQTTRYGINAMKRNEFNDTAKQT